MMGKFKRPTLSLEFSWPRARVLIGAAVSAVMGWAVLVYPLLRYLERNIEWLSAGINWNQGYYRIHVEYNLVLFLLLVVAVTIASAKTDKQHRGALGPVIFASLVMVVIILLYFGPLGRLGFAVVLALSLVPTVLLASCVVIRGGWLLGRRILIGLTIFFWATVTCLYYSDEELSANWLASVMDGAVSTVNYSHYHADRVQAQVNEQAVIALAAAPQLRELGNWKIALADSGGPWGEVYDGGMNEDFLDFLARFGGAGDEKSVVESGDSDDGEQRRALNKQLKRSGEYDKFMLWVVELGLVKNAYVVTDRQIVRCLTLPETRPEKRKGIVFVDQRPVSDVVLDDPLLYCFDGQTTRGVGEGVSGERVSSPCQPLHGFSNFSLDKVDIWLALVLHLWAVDGPYLKRATAHFMDDFPSKEAEGRLLGLLAQANDYFEAGDVGLGRARLEEAVEFVQGLTLNVMRESDVSSDKRAFVESMFAARQARVAGDEELAEEHEAACLEHRGRWYERDPQVGLLERTGVSANLLLEDTSAQLVMAVGLVGEAQAAMPKIWSEEGFWLRKLEHDRVLIEQASSLFGTVLDSFVSSRNRESEYERVRKLFARSPDRAFKTLRTEGIEVSRYFLGSEHNGWCVYRLAMKVGEAGEDGKRSGKLGSVPRYCRVDDVLLSFDADGKAAGKWDATGFPFAAPVVVGDVPRWRGMSGRHRAQRRYDDERDALLRLFLDQLVDGELEDVESMNIELHPGAQYLHDGHRAAMERMRLEGKSVQ